MQALSKRWAGVVVLAIWIVAIAAGGLLDQEGLHRASRFLAGAAVAAAGSALILDWQGISREAAFITPDGGHGGASSRWDGKGRDGGSFVLRIFGAFAALAGTTLFLSGFAWNP